MDYFPSPKYGMIYRPGIYNIQAKNKKKTSEKWPRVKFHLSHYATTKQPPISTLLKNMRWSKMRYVICRPGLYNLKSRKSLKTYIR